MRIHIENYRNINSIDYEIDDRKINYLFGVCGSGKSSIVNAATRAPEPADTTIGLAADRTCVTIDGTSGYANNARVYNASEQEIIFRKGASNGSYEVFIGSEQALRELEDQFNDAVSGLKSFSDLLYAYQGRIQELKDAVGKPNKGKFTSASRINKAAKVARNTTPFLKHVIAEGGLDYASWLAQGLGITSHFASGICPFCDKNLSEEKCSDFSILQDLKVSDLKPVISASTLLESFNINNSDLETEEGADAVRARLLLLFKISDEIAKVTAFCNTPKTSLLDTGLPTLKVDDCIYEEFPQLNGPISLILQKTDEINSLLGKMKSTFNGIIKKNCSRLNRELKRLSIPYFFKINIATRDNKTADYVLIHVNSEHDIDMRDNLSTGEKNLVALMLFLSNDTGDILFIDDPASSFDDFRRTQIIDLIHQVNDKTVLVVSHDQAFVKRAVHGKGRFKNLGRVQALSKSSEGLCVNDINDEDVVYLPDEIAKVIENSESYWQKAINFRLLCDLRKEIVGDAWGYSSMILHRRSKEDILLMLKENGISEQELLDKVNSVLGINMPPLPDGYAANADSRDFSDFEKLVELRENIDPSKGEAEKEQRRMLNDLVHMNDTAAYGLNPYKYQLWSTELENLLNQQAV